MTDRERQIGTLLLQGCSSARDIAASLGRGEETIRNNSQQMYEKFDLQEHSSKLLLVLFLHRNRALLGIRCETCRET